VTVCKTLAEEQEELRVAWLALWLVILEAFGLIAFARRRGWTVRPWVREAEERRAARER